MSWCRACPAGPRQDANSDVVVPVGTAAEVITAGNWDHEGIINLDADHAHRASFIRWSWSLLISPVAPVELMVHGGSHTGCTHLNSKARRLHG
jgi:hypothetical protein